MRFIWLIALVCSVLLPSSALAADQCITCHTDPARLQASIQPPAEIAQEEGEG